MNIPYMVMKLCEEHNMSIHKLEKELGFGQGSIMKWDKSAPRADRLKAVADYFGVTVDYLINGIMTEQMNLCANYTDEYTALLNGGYYLYTDTAEKAQALFDDENMRLLFDAAKDSRPEDLQMAAELLKRLKATNPDG